MLFDITFDGGDMSKFSKISNDMINDMIFFLLIKILILLTFFPQLQGNSNLYMHFE